MLSSELTVWPGGSGRRGGEDPCQRPSLRWPQLGLFSRVSQCLWVREECGLGGGASLEAPSPHPGFGDGSRCRASRWLVLSIMPRPGWPRTSMAPGAGKPHPASECHPGVGAQLQRGLSSKAAVTKCHRLEGLKPQILSQCWRLGVRDQGAGPWRAGGGLGEGSLPGSRCPLLAVSPCGREGVGSGLFLF